MKKLFVIVVFSIENSSISGVFVMKYIMYYENSISEVCLKLGCSVRRIIIVFVMFVE